MTRRAEDIRRDLRLIRERERWSDIHNARIGQILDDVLVLLARAVAAERERDEARAQLETVAAQLRQCIDERNHRIKERVAAEARLTDYRELIEQTRQWVETFDCDCFGGTIDQDPERCDRCTFLARFAALAAPSPQAEPEPTAERWAVDLIDCGRDDGVQVCATWAAADALRQSYVAAAEDMRFCERNAIIHRAAPDARIGYHDPAPYLPPSPDRHTTVPEPEGLCDSPSPQAEPEADYFEVSVDPETGALSSRPGPLRREYEAGDHNPSRPSPQAETGRDWPAADECGCVPEGSLNEPGRHTCGRFGSSASPSPQAEPVTMDSDGVIAMNEFPLDAVRAWADEVATIRESGQQVAYSQNAVPQLVKRHDDMLRALLTWHRSMDSAHRPPQAEQAPDASWVTFEDARGRRTDITGAPVPGPQSTEETQP